MIINQKVVGFKSFSAKVIAMAIIVFCIILSLLIVLLTYRETLYLEESYYRRGQDMLSGVREASRIALLAEDTERLQTVATENMKHRPEILYTVFFRGAGEKLYTSVKDNTLQLLLVQLSDEHRQIISPNSLTWESGTMTRTPSSSSNHGPVTEFWSKVSSSGVSELEMFSDASVKPAHSGVERVSGYICLGVSRAELKGTTSRIILDALIAGFVALLTMSGATVLLYKETDEAALRVGRRCSGGSGR